MFWQTRSASSVPAVSFLQRELHNESQVFMKLRLVKLFLFPHLKVPVSLSQRETELAGVSLRRLLSEDSRSEVYFAPVWFGTEASQTYTLHAGLPHKSSLAAWKLNFFTTRFNGIGFSAINFSKSAFKKRNPFTLSPDCWFSPQTHQNGHLALLC